MRDDQEEAMTDPEYPPVHCVIRYDPDDGEPYGEVCYCQIGEDHDGTGVKR